MQYTEAAAAGGGGVRRFPEELRSDMGAHSSISLFFREGTYNSMYVYTKYVTHFFNLWQVQLSYADPHIM